MKHNNLNFLKQKIIHGMIVLILRDFGMKIVSITGQIILVRLVAPEYFGIFTIIVFVVSIAEMFTDFGLSQAIIQNKKGVTNTQLSTIFYLKLVLSIVAFLLLILSFSTIRLIYYQLTDENFLMILVFGSVIIIKAIKSILLALFDKDLNFSTVSKIDMIGIITYVVVAVFLATYKLYVWNFIFAILLKEIIELAIAFYYNPWKPKFIFDLKSIRQMIQYGSFLQIGNIVAFLERSIIPITGFRLSSYSLGLLDWSSKVAGLSDALFENFGRVGFAGMTKIQDKKDKISLIVNKSNSILNIFSFLFVILVLGYSKEFTILILSEKWIPALPSLYWFVSSLLFYSGSITIAHALLAMGKSKEVTIFTTPVILMGVVFAFLMTIYMGFMGIAFASFVMYFVEFVGYYFLGRKFDLDIKLKKPFFDKFLIFIFLGCVVVLLNLIFSSFSLTTLIIKFTVTIAIYGVSLFLFSRDEIKEFIKMTSLYGAKTSML